jgi:CelD/BcsL family acetyltransferase involved in cellulose biosynthesis
LQELLRSNTFQLLTIAHADAAGKVARGLARFPLGRVDRSVRLVATVGPRLLTRRSGKHRSAMRRSERKLAEDAGGPVQVRVCSVSEDLKWFIPAASAIAQRTWQRGIRADFSASPLRRALLEQDAAAGRLRAYLLECGRTPVAFQIGVEHSKRYDLECIGYDSRYASLSPGAILLNKSFEDITGRDIAEFHFGFGDADYKRHYSDREIADITIHLYSRSLRGRTAYGLEHTVASARPLAVWLRDAGFGRSSVKKFIRSLMARRVPASHS